MSGKVASRFLQRRLGGNKIAYSNQPPFPSPSPSHIACPYLPRLAVVDGHVHPNDVSAAPGPSVTTGRHLPVGDVHLLALGRLTHCQGDGGLLHGRGGEGADSHTAEVMGASCKGGAGEGPIHTLPR